jgi:hypothetical protein
MTIYYISKMEKPNCPPGMCTSIQKAYEPSGDPTFRPGKVVSYTPEELNRGLKELYTALDSE